MRKWNRGPGCVIAAAAAVATTVVDVVVGRTQTAALLLLAKFSYLKARVTLVCECLRNSDSHKTSSTFQRYVVRS